MLGDPGPPEDDCAQVDRHPSEESEQGYVFISYAHDDEDHKESVRELWIYLRSNGINASCDLSAADERQDWPLWMSERISKAKFVLIIGSPEYRLRSEGKADAGKGRGVQWEASLIRGEFYRNRSKALKKFIPVILPGRTVADLPAWLGADTITCYDLSNKTAFGTERLVRLLTNQPIDPEPALGPTPLLPSRTVPTSIAGTECKPQLSLTTSIAPESRLVAPLSRLFLHFFDPHFLEEVSRGRNRDHVAAETAKATRLAVLAAEVVFVPAASYIESDLCAKIINEYRSLFSNGHILLIGGEANIIDFACAKLIQYEEDGDHYQKYIAAIELDVETPPFRSRKRSATADIENGWNEKLGDLGSFLSQIPLTEVPDFEARWADVPSALEGRAFTPEYALPALLGTRQASGTQLIVARRAGSYINTQYFKSYTTELDAGVVTDLTYLHSPHTAGSAVDLPYKSVMRALEERGMIDVVLTADPEKLLELRADPRVAASITRAITQTPARK